VTSYRSVSLVARTTSAEATRELAAGVAAHARAGDLILLAGDLGTGKTVFVQGFARGLGIDEQVTSPTFVLLRPYEGPLLRLLHADIYRLDQLSEVLDLGLLEQLEDKAVACVEWGDLAEPVLPADFLAVRLTYGDDDDERVVEARPVGARWHTGFGALLQTLDPWLVER
jgi:tRNA threonylcarbamoyladenosine biosynthesis protein TsaE